MSGAEWMAKKRSGIGRVDGAGEHDGPVIAVALPLLPKRALTLAQELLTRGVQAIKADS